MKKQKFQKLGIKKSTISQLTQNQINGGGTHCCPTALTTCAHTCAATCANTCANTCQAACGVTNTCGGGSGSRTSDFCPTIQI